MANKDDLINSFVKILEKKDPTTQVAKDPFLSRIKLVHEVVANDSLWKIAKDNHVPLSHILALNPELRGKENKLQIGQKIKVPYSPMDLAQEMRGKPLENMITELANAYGIDPKAFRQALFEESKLDPAAVNPNTKATGLGQLMPETVQMYGVTDPTDAAQNAAAAAAHLKSYIDAARKLSPDADEDLILWNALMMYNWGIGNFIKWQKGGKKEDPPKEARIHPAKVFYGMKKDPPPPYVAFYNEFVRGLGRQV